MYQQKTPPPDKATMYLPQTQTLAAQIMALIPLPKRPLVVQLLSMIPAHMKSYRDIAPLLVLDDLDTAITALRARWKQTSTCISKISTLLFLAKQNFPGTSPSCVLNLKKLKARLSQTRTPAWFPGDEQKCIPPSHIRRMVRFPNLHPLILAWLLGHRIGDILLLRTSNVFYVRTANSTQTMAILFVEGKAVGSTGPYCVHLPVSLSSDLSAMRIIQQAFLEARKARRPYLFLNAQHILVKEQILPWVTAQETYLKQQLQQNLAMTIDLRSLRRGGVTNAAQATGADHSSLRTLTRHPSDETLRIYLGAGLLDTTTAKIQSSLVKANEISLNKEMHDPFFVLRWSGPHE